MASNKIKVMIAGMTYTLVSNDSKEELEKIASFVDKKIREINNYKLTREMNLVLASLNISDELFKLARKYESLEEKAKEPLENYPKLLKKIENLSYENEKIKEDFEKNNKEILKSVEKTKQLNDTIRQLNSQIDKLEKIDASKNEDLKKSRELVLQLQTKLLDFQKEIEILKRDL